LVKREPTSPNPISVLSLPKKKEGRVGYELQTSGDEKSIQRAFLKPEAWSPKP
jgi:hypothetical protein